MTLLARGEKALGEAVEALEGELRDREAMGKGDSKGEGGGYGGCEESRVRYRAVDVSDYAAVETVAKELCGTDAGPPSMLFNVAGISSSERFVETEPKEFDRLMRVNYLGTAYATRAFLPHMLGKESGYDGRGSEGGLGDGMIVLTSSAAGQVGVYGYSAYSPTKYALRGLAEVLAMELPPHVKIQIAYPPDTDTPGYELEQVGKSRETQLISESAGLFRAEDVARSMVAAALSPRPSFQVYFGLEGWMLSTLTSGMGPVYGMIDALSQVVLMGLLRLVSLFYLADFRRIVKRCYREKVVAQMGDGIDGRSVEEKVVCRDNRDNGVKTYGEGEETIKGEWLCGGAGW